MRVTNNSTRGDDEEGREEIGLNYSSQISQSSSVKFDKNGNRTINVPTAVIHVGSQSFPEMVVAPSNLPTMQSYNDSATLTARLKQLKSRQF